MTKTEIIYEVAKKTGLKEKDAKKAIDALIDAVTFALQKGDKVTIPGFGTLSTSVRAERRGRHPQTGKEMAIPAATVVHFSAGKTLKESLNS